MHFANLLSCLLFLPAINAAQCSKNPYARFFTIGNTSALVTSDGQFTTILSSFFSAPDIAVESAFKGLFRSVQPLVWSQNNVVIDHPDGRILIDTGSANFPAPSFSKAGLLRENLLAAGIEPSSIKNVLITHGHADHVSGLRTKDGDRAFPNATVYVSRVEHMFWTSEPFVIPNALAPNATLGKHSLFCPVCIQCAVSPELLTAFFFMFVLCCLIATCGEQSCSKLFIAKA